MSDKPNQADFSVDEKTGEYEITISIERKITRKIKADSIKHAEAMAEDMADKIADGDDDAEPDEVDDVRVCYVRRATPMFRVTREGAAMQVSHLIPGDLPRDANERGF